MFGGRKVEFRFAVEAQRAVEGRVAWGLAVERATVARGEAAVVAGPQKPGEVTVRLDLPEAREGVVVPAVLSLAVESPGRAGTPLASLEKRLWIFPENPFALRTRWLEQLDIRLFDPGQKTQRVLEKMKVPFRETRQRGLAGRSGQGARDHRRGDFVCGVPRAGQGDRHCGVPGRPA